MSATIYTPTTKPFAVLAILLGLAVACTAGSGTSGVLFEDGGTEGEIEADGGGKLDAKPPVKACAKKCPDNQVCTEGTCVALPDQCPCPKEAICDLGAGKCKVGCLGDDDCNQGRFCDPSIRKCAPGCRVNDDCPITDTCDAHQCVNKCASKKCDDKDPCTADSCERGACVAKVGPEGAACTDDKNACTGDVCKSGKCTHPAANEGGTCADDASTCTTDVCRAGTCKHEATNEGASCPDVPCQAASKCKAGKCAGTPYSDGSKCEGAFNYCYAGACEAAKAYCDQDTDFNGLATLGTMIQPGKADQAVSKGICSCDGATAPVHIDLGHLTGTFTHTTDVTIYCTKCKGLGTNSGLGSSVCW